jgi:hypothetical protein
MLVTELGMDRLVGTTQFANAPLPMAVIVKLAISANPVISRNAAI